MSDFTECSDNAPLHIGLQLKVVKDLNNLNKMNFTDNGGDTERTVFKCKEEFKNQFIQLLVVDADKLKNTVSIEGEITQNSINKLVNFS